MRLLPHIIPLAILLSLGLLSFGLRVHAVVIVDPSAGPHVRREDCVHALRLLWGTRASSVQAAYQTEQFSIISANRDSRLPQRFTHRTCCIGVYMTSAFSATASLSWYTISTMAEAIIAECYRHAAPGCCGINRDSGLDVVVGDPYRADVTGGCRHPAFG
ncbi:hypothetical protein MMC15_006780 [Xylographa vitiligo]|nr:hypothetical protein [Xylographa vitiligo]